MIAGLVARVLRKDILPPNTRIEEAANDTGLTAGHSFSDVYLKYRGAEIVGGIEKALGKPTAGYSDVLENIRMSENTTQSAPDVSRQSAPPKAESLTSGSVYSNVLENIRMSEGAASPCI